VLRQGRKGFTLIELLVVIAIIAILAAMLFPVFARARESARKIQCLANVKNIALAVQMYLTDYDRFPPSEHRAEIVAWAQDRCGCDGGGGCCKDRISGMNPYLRWPVILDEYVKNRDVWRCPSSRREYQYTINSGYAGDAGGDWWKEYLANVDACPTPQPCTGPFPPGWGGTVTDTILQGENGCAGPGTGGVAFGIGVTAWHTLDQKTSEMKDPAKKVICADAGVKMDLERTSWIAYPDTCHLDCAACTDWYPDWVNCSFTQECGAGNVQFGLDPQYRKDHAHARHLGGSNIGFADGHAAWMPAEVILFGGDLYNAAGRTNAPLEGLAMCGSFYP